MSAATLDDVPLAEVARRAWQAEPHLSARELAERFDRSARWARDRIREAREVLPPAAVGVVEDDVLRDGARDFDTLTRATWWCSSFAVLVVGLVALVISFDHVRLLAEESGEGWRSWLLPVSLDGLMVAASLLLLARRRAGVAAGWLPWASLAAGVAASVAANVVQAEPDVVARLVAAWPPVAALAGVELLLSQARTEAAR